MSQWINVCPLNDILPGTGVCALVGSHQVAVFRPYQDEQVFAISNIDGIVSTAIRNALDNLSNASLTFRRYVSTDLSAPASPPFTLAIKEGSWTATEVQITAGYMNILDTSWPRYRYTLTDFPGLRYLQ